MVLSSISKKGLAISLLGIAPSMLDWQEANASETYTYSLPQDETSLIYPNVDWLPEPYQKYYEGMSVEDVIKLFTENSLQRDGISFDSVSVNSDPTTSAYVVSIISDDPNVAAYQVVHPQFITNYNAALQGRVSNSRIAGTRTIATPWAFFPQSDCWNKVVLVRWTVRGPD